MRQSRLSPETTRGVVRFAVKQVIFTLILAAGLFLSAGRWDWPAGWFYLGLIFILQVFTVASLVVFNPELAAERSGLKPGSKIWDVSLAVVMAYGLVWIGIAAGLEVRLCTPPVFPLWLQIAGLLMGAAGSALTQWAMLVNDFFSGVVRIQSERGHQVVDCGPYAAVRHPGYTGALVFYLVAPLVLSSRWGFAASVLVVVVTILRTFLEDRTLQVELKDYSDYARRVRWRLIPGIW